MISNIKNVISPLIGKSISFRYNGSRNQIDEFEGVVLNCYNYVFIIKVDDLIRSFSYSDVLMGVLEVNV